MELRRRQLGMLWSLVSLAVISLHAISEEAHSVYRCGNEYTITAAPGCKLMEGSNVAVVPGSRVSASGNSPQGGRIAMKKRGGTFVVPVLVNNAITLDFVIDSGAADVSVPADVFSTLVRAGTISQADITGSQTYTLADGSTMQSRTFVIRSLKIGGNVIQDVIGSVAPTNGHLLLGQSFLNRFKTWSIDNAKKELVLN